MASSQPSGNLFQMPEPLPAAEVLTPLVESPPLRVERILSSGQTTSPGQWYDQTEAEWVVLLQGEALLTYGDDARLSMKAGDYVLIPPHTRHRVDYTSQDPPCIWLAVHFEAPTPP